MSDTFNHELDAFESAFDHDEFGIPPDLESCKSSPPFIPLYDFNEIDEFESGIGEEFA